MSKKVAETQQVKVSKRANKLEEVLDHGLRGTIAYSGGELTGFSVKVGNVDFLMTLRAHFPAGHKIAWVGASTLVALVLKAERLAAESRLEWRPDKYKED